jgi:hypothetical protein
MTEIEFNDNNYIIHLSPHDISVYTEVARLVSSDLGVTWNFVVESLPDYVPEGEYLRQGNYTLDTSA